MPRSPTDVDECNRRSDARDFDFAQKNSEITPATMSPPGAQQLQHRCGRSARMDRKSRIASENKSWKAGSNGMDRLNTRPWEVWRRVTNFTRCRWRRYFPTASCADYLAGFLSFLAHNWSAERGPWCTLSKQRAQRLFVSISGATDCVQGQRYLPTWRTEK